MSTINYKTVAGVQISNIMEIDTPEDGKVGFTVTNGVDEVWCELDATAVKDVAIQLLEWLAGQAR